MPSTNSSASLAQESAALPDTTIVKRLNAMIEIHYENSWQFELQERIESNRSWDDWMLYQLNYEAEQAQCIHSFDQLLSLSCLPAFTPLPHQISTARRVVHEMGGRAILADEVGLGKTIEAGLIIKEYLLRGLVKRALILVPASLVLQWVRELNQKFGIKAIAQKKAHAWDCDIVVASLDTAKREPHRTRLLESEYDLLIIDEAHKLKNKQSTNFQFVNQLHKKYCLLLTATPIQNDMSELYNLVTLLKPGQLGGQGDFSKNYVADKRQARNEEELQQIISEVMIRNKRSDGDLSFTKRIVRNVPLELSPEEQALYEGVSAFVKSGSNSTGFDLGSMLALVTLQREVCSSRDAVFLTLVNMFKKTEEDSPIRARIWELVENIRGITSNTKAEKALELVKQLGDKVIIFTEYRATQEYLLQFFQSHNISAVTYRGGMNRGKKDWMMDLFRKRAQILIATEAGGEGINLQFCRNIINFDLPWNPMRVEQRIGRVHRLGQQHDVHIYNLCTLHTIEEHIVRLLHEKINLFEMVIGELDQIIERMEKKDGSLEQQLARLMLEATDEQELEARISQLGDSFKQAAKKQLDPEARK